MADKRLLEILRKGPEAWNRYRKESPGDVRPDLSWADLRGAKLHEANLNLANLSRANLSRADLSGADLSGADLGRADLQRARLFTTKLLVAEMVRADLSHAYLGAADFSGANLSDANFTHADLSGADFDEAKLIGADLRYSVLSGAKFVDTDLSAADLTQAVLYKTLLINVRLGNTAGLESCQHVGPSTIDHLTLANNPSLPLEFLRGCGLPDFMINQHDLLHGKPIQFYSCFISYSGGDEHFAKRLYNDLQRKGIRCWFAREDLKTGERLRDRINEAIRVHDKLLLILSRNSIYSDWVETEVEKAFAEEQRRSKDPASVDERPTVLFPIRLDDEIQNSDRAWAENIRLTRHIGDFTQWKDHDAYQKAFGRLLRDLHASGEI